MLEVSHLSKTYTSGFLGNKRVDAVKDVSFKVNSGEIFGLIGAAADTVCISASSADLPSAAGYLFCLCRADTVVSPGPAYE